MPVLHNPPSKKSKNNSSKSINTNTPWMDKEKQTLENRLKS